jgi:homoserine kinase
MQHCINELKSANASMRQLLNVANDENMSREEILAKVRSISLSNDNVISSLMGNMNGIKQTLPENGQEVD